VGIDETGAVHVGAAALEFTLSYMLRRRKASVTLARISYLISKSAMHASEQYYRILKGPLCPTVGCRSLLNLLHISVISTPFVLAMSNKNGCMVVASLANVLQDPLIERAKSKSV
jgi:hypothetical protein